MIKLSIPEDSEEDSSVQLPSPRLKGEIMEEKEEIIEEKCTPLFNSKKTKHKADPLTRFVDRIMGRGFYNSLPSYIFNDSNTGKISTRLMDGHKMMRGSFDSVPFVALCAQINDKREDTDLVLGINKRECIRAFILTTSTYKGKACLSLTIGSACLMYDINDNQDQDLCKKIVEPLMNGKSIEGFKVDRKAKTVERDQTQQIILTDQSEFKFKFHCFVTPRCSLF